MVKGAMVNLQRSLRTSRPFRALIVVALLFGLLVQLAFVARAYSANWDEAHHLFDGYNIWTHHDYRLNAEVPPLVKLTAALPLLPMRLVYPADAGKSQAEDAFLEGRAFVFGNGGDRVLFPARMACMIFTLLLAWTIYAAARNMFSTLAAVCALFLFIFDPNVLAHGTLVSTDIASALFLFASAYAFYRYAKTPATSWLLTTGLLAGLAMVAKFTGILVIPMLLLLSLADAIRLRSWQTLGRRLGACSAIFVVSWGIIWAFYGFRYAPAPNGLALSPHLGPYLASLPNKGSGSMLAFLARLRLLPEAYLWGLANTKHTEWEYTSFFWGRMYRHGPWEYFPVAFLIKSTIPLLLLLVCAPALPDFTKKAKGQELAFLLIPVCVYFAVVTTSHFDIGARHLMPIYPFLYVIAGATAAQAFTMGRLWAIIAILLLLWQPVTSLRVAPAYMAYGNEAWGGPLQVRNYLSDANVDWGQQLKAVKSYLDTNHIHDCWFAYFPDGAVEPQDYGVPCRRLPTPSALFWLDLPMNVPPTINGTVLISESDLEGVESGDGPLNPYDTFRGLKPIAVIQGGVYVFQGQFAIPLASAWVDVRTSNRLEKAGQSQAALAVAQHAATLAPNSTRVQLNLANKLAAQSKWSDALTHYQAAEHSLQTNRPELEIDDFRASVEKGMATAVAHGSN